MKESLIFKEEETSVMARLISVGSIFVRSGGQIRGGFDNILASAAS